MADVTQKSINANSIKFGTVTVKANGANRSTSFKYDTKSQQVDPDGESTTFWENKLTGRFTHGDFKLT